MPVGVRESKPICMLMLLSDFGYLVLLVKLVLVVMAYYPIAGQDSLVITVSC